MGHVCVNAIGVCKTDLKRWETSTTGWGCSSPHFIRCGADGDVWQPTDIRGLCRKLRRGFSVPKVPVAKWWPVAEWLTGSFENSSFSGDRPMTPGSERLRNHLARLLVCFCFAWISFGCQFHRRKVPDIHGWVETMLASRGLAEADDLAHGLICRAPVRHLTSPTRSRAL